MAKYFFIGGAILVCAILSVAWFYFYFFVFGKKKRREEEQGNRALTKRQKEKRECDNGQYFIPAPTFREIPKITTPFFTDDDDKENQDENKP